ncbi:hypothetical protein U9M48_002087 [Paspalum notatum var. saurae]|uniref:Uncharacterized protein n=1 Tax=Paspalum notatum var. saurae TaxID=547442 RepID=A0AAQ3PGM2_PASNO
MLFGLLSPSLYYQRTDIQLQTRVATTGEKPSALDMYIMAHRGPDPSQPELLSTPLATEQLEKYGKDMV